VEVVAQQALDLALLVLSHTASKQRNRDPVERVRVESAAKLTPQQVRAAQAQD
jgi:hypothetical protein